MAAVSTHGVTTRREAIHVPVDSSILATDITAHVRFVSNGYNRHVKFISNGYNC